MNGRAFWLGLTLIAGVVAAVTTENVWTAAHERANDSILGPVIWEYSSLVTFVLSAPIGWVALRLAPLRWPPNLFFAPVHLAAYALFVVGHVGGFILLRELIYWLAGFHYHYGASFAAALGYEGFKDAFGYALLITSFTLSKYLLAQRSAQTMTPMPFDIRDGASIVRVHMDDILAISSAGNYVEFALRDGRKPMARRSLSSVESELGARGFVRTHRSWLVNKAHVTGLKPDGSGDYTVELGQLSAPLSRRFPEALAELRAG